MEFLKKFYTPQNFLDLGCGSGILSISSAIMWKNLRVLAIDIDQDSIRTCNLNIKKNYLHSRIKCELNNGIKNSNLFRSEYFDLLVSNILPGPLKKLAYHSILKLTNNGYLVLSGILKHQTNDILLKYKNFGLIKIKEFRIKNWSTIIMKKI